MQMLQLESDDWSVQGFWVTYDLEGDVHKVPGLPEHVELDDLDTMSDTDSLLEAEGIDPTEEGFIKGYLEA